jgi:hypothetical protein
MQQVGSRRLLSIAIIVFFLAAAAVIVLIVIFRTTISVSSLTHGALQQEVLAEATPVQAQETMQTEEASVSEDCMQAALTVIDGVVTLRRAGEDDFSPVTGSVWVGCGDVIRTGSSGSAQLVFFTDTETTIFPNSEMTLTDFARDSDGSFLIRMEQTIGRLFHRVNFPTGNSQHEVVTPHGVAAVRGTAYWSIVHVEGDVDSFYCLVGILSVTVSETGRNETITCPSVTIDIGADGALSTRPLDLYCGDGLCDAYMDEDAVSCPEDCE